MRKRNEEGSDLEVSTPSQAHTSLCEAYTTVHSQSRISASEDSYLQKSILYLGCGSEPARRVPKANARAAAAAASVGLGLGLGSGLGLEASG